MINKFIIYLLFIVLALTSCSRAGENKDASLNYRKQEEIFLKVPEETKTSIGLKTQPVEIKKVSFKLKFNGIVKEIPNKTFYISSPVNGRVTKVFVEPNQIVKRGETLGEISSQDIAELQFDVTREQIDLEGQAEDAKLELSLAQAGYERETKLFNDGITAKKDFLEAENRFKIAQHDLERLEKKKKSTTELAEKRLSILGAHSNVINTQAGLIEIKTPADTIVLKRLINPGEVVEKDKLLFEASDLKEVYIESQIYEKDFPKIKVGEKITFVTEACPNEVFNGEVNFISQIADPQTRTIAVKAKIHNLGFKLKPEIFGKMLISLSEEEALIISKEAVQKIENNDVVYAKSGDGFKEVKVKLGRETDGLVEVVSPLTTKDEVVTNGSFWLKSELHSD